MSPIDSQATAGVSIAAGTLSQDRDALLEVRELRVTFKLGSRRHEAVHGVDFDVRRGESVGIVGESGSGKSVTALSLLRLLEESADVSGCVRLRGVDLVDASPRALRRLRGAQVGFVFQDPLGSLNPALRLGRQLTEVLRLHRRDHGRSAEQRALRMLAQVGINDPKRRMRQYPHQISGGMRQRVMIAAALITDPELVILDEPTTALDVTIQAQILALLADLRRQLGMSLLLISHDLGVVSQVADRILVMYAGRIVEQGPTAEVLAAPVHPYTKGLLASRPQLERPRSSTLTPIPGTPPSLAAHRSDACSFAPRCPYAFDRCLVELPLPRVGTHTAACHLLDRLETAEAPQ